MNNDGGSAFPFPHPPIATRAGGVDLRGMSLRDYFAAKAMQGLLCHELDRHYHIAAEDAYAYADAMLKVRDPK